MKRKLLISVFIISCMFLKNIDIYAKEIPKTDLSFFAKNIIENPLDDNREALGPTKVAEKYEFPNGDTLERKIYFNISNPLLMINGNIVHKNVTVMMNNKVLIPIQIISEFIDTDIRFDYKSKNLFIDYKGKKTVLSKDMLEEIGYVLVQNQLYVPLEFLSKHMGLQIQFLEKDHEIVLSNIICIDETSNGGLTKKECIVYLNNILNRQYEMYVDFLKEQIAKAPEERDGIKDFDEQYYEKIDDENMIQHINTAKKIRTVNTKDWTVEEFSRYYFVGRFYIDKFTKQIYFGSSTLQNFKIMKLDLDDMESIKRLNYCMWTG